MVATSEKTNTQQDGKEIYVGAIIELNKQQVNLIPSPQYPTLGTKCRWRSHRSLAGTPVIS